MIRLASIIMIMSLRLPDRGGISFWGRVQLRRAPNGRSTSSRRRTRLFPAEPIVTVGVLAILGAIDLDHLSSLSRETSGDQPLAAFDTSLWLSSKHIPIFVSQGLEIEQWHSQDTLSCCHGISHIQTRRCCTGHIRVLVSAPFDDCDRQISDAFRAADDKWRILRSAYLGGHRILLEL